MNRTALPIPRIWGGQAACASVLSGQCDCDCSDCVCDACSDQAVHPGTQPQLSTLQNGIQWNKMGPVRVNPDAYRQRVGENLVVLGPLAQGPLVLDAAGASMLDDAVLPIPLESLCERVQWSKPVLEQVTALLLDRGCLLAENLPEQKISENPASVLSAWLTLTTRCNLDCVYCYVPRHGRNSQMHPETAGQAVEAVFRSAARGGFRKVKLKYSGGEPTLNFNTLMAAQAAAERLSAASGIHLESVVLSNGLAISSSQMKLLAAHGMRVMVSLDGIGESHDANRPLAGSGAPTFSRVLQTIDRLLSRGISPHISITVTRRSLPGVPSLVTALLERSLRFSLNFYRPPEMFSLGDPLACTQIELVVGMQKIYHAIEAHLPPYSLYAGLTDRANPASPHRRTCGAGVNYLVIGLEGQVSSCQMELAHPASHISNPNLFDALQQDQNLQNLSVEEKIACAACPWRYRCSGGCPRLAYQSGGSFGSRSPLCAVYQAVLPEAIRLEALRMVRYDLPWSPVEPGNQM